MTVVAVKAPDLLTPVHGCTRGDAGKVGESLPALEPLSDAEHLGHFVFRQVGDLVVAQLCGLIDLWCRGTVTHASLHRSGLQQGICCTALVRALQASVNRRVSVA